MLLVVGRSGPGAVAQHKRCSSYDHADWLLLERFVGEDASLVVTSHCLAEASNLLRHTNAPTASRLMRTLSDTIGERALEVVTPLANLAASMMTYLELLGIADAGIIMQLSLVDAVLTDDAGLYDGLYRQGIVNKAIINFNHVRF